mmetsp:Transcript_8912/g.14489  ORF Transcript_8912/g.14489 Transcript_8912/m.14489 type:complete len:171 (-) Transcript_8912:682-1194(-)|eukprot:CAMPEP_0203762350 /NCGR_PEP_ID=MMETSP0098-20131031/15261_1 /ASSEMBLY_ACC=CAM_ASM_000208 /TAXON_ID=96639 /ORGANISM=" , Strain NY0313808BC1" /LENGTH=170 /DNA_ID=CAMNT_0050656729 /DNA_START=115 /DNA_END=627 /DNA_ORIENTATION=-
MSADVGFDVRITEALDALSNSLKENDDPLSRFHKENSHASKRLRPWDRDAYEERMRSFHPFNWFGKLKIVDKSVCAAKGWKAVGKDELLCESCHKRFKYECMGENERAYAEKFVKLLESTHYDLCIWRSIPFEETSQYLRGFADGTTSDETSSEAAAVGIEAKINELLSY